MKNNLEVSLAKEICFIFTKQTDGPILINTILTEKHANNVKELHGKVIGYTICPECKENMKKAFMLIGVIESKTKDKDNPYRSGNVWGVSFDYAKKLFKNNIPEKGIAFIDAQAANDIGLPGANINA